MASVSGQNTTFNVVNFEGDLYNITPTDTKLLAAIAGGGIGGGAVDAINTTLFSWQETDLRVPGQNVALEGAAAPAATGRTRTNVFNVLQIIHETVEVSDTKQAAFNQVQDVGATHAAISATGQGNPVRNELGFQSDLMLKQIARDIEFTLFEGTFVDSVDNSTARQTRGLLAAITTNAIDAEPATTIALSASSSSDDILIDAAHGLVDGDRIQFSSLTGGAGLETSVTYYVVNATTGTFQVSTEKNGTPVDFTTDISAAEYYEPSDPTVTNVLDLMQSVYDNGGIMEEETAVLIVNSSNTIGLNSSFLSVSGAGFRQQDRRVGGTNLSTIVTPFGELGLMLNRHCPQGTVVVASLEQLKMKWLAQERGTFYAEPLPRLGISQRVQFSGEWGLEYGNERAHGKITNLATRPA